jgi:hypothetical protein
MYLNSRTEAVLPALQDGARALSDGLHQTTQPLTVLQGTLELALLTANTVREYRQAIERSLGELQRLTDCFEHLRTLIRLQQPVSEIGTFGVSSIATCTRAKKHVSAAIANSASGRLISQQEAVPARVARENTEPALDGSLPAVLVRSPEAYSADVLGQTKQSKGAVSYV